MKTWFAFLGLAAVTLRAALGDASLLADQADSSAFPLARAGAIAPLRVAADDWPGVRRAVGDLRDDLEKVTGVRPALAGAPEPAERFAVIIGTTGHSSLIDDLVARGKLDVGAIRGRWEAYQIETIEQPLPGVERALVIVGSDKRGTIYGIYELSQQIGVSPWAWWADVPVPRRTDLAIRAGRTVNPGPVVRYRGIFLNDEAPALTGWAQEKFGGFNQAFYAKVFELLLRLRANYLWPAMWRPQAFADDDPGNPALADEFGIVMGTSHHEPMMRAHEEWARHGQGPWDYAKNGERLRAFWRGGLDRGKNLESIVTLGMRGDGDEPMSEHENVALLERIVADQRRIIADVTGRPVEATPQLWALYKEVQGYYERGMRVPDDVTLLWCDDNWGNLRRLPTEAERRRPGGAGIYYHFDYVGGPRNYKWLNVTPLPKIWEQLHLAWRHGADRIWIVNVGDLKPMEIPIEFFLTFAWDPARWPYETLDRYAEAWAAREFGPAHAPEIAALASAYPKLNRRRTPELLAPDTFSLVNYREADRVLAEWRDLAARAQRVAAALPAAAQPAFLQLVHHPIEASANLNELLVAAGLNRLHAAQGRASANATAERVRSLFARDAALTRRWDGLLDGKWRRLMDQVHLGYTTWQQPVANIMPAVSEVQIAPAGRLALAVEGDPASRPGDYPVSPVAVLPALSAWAPERTRWLEVFNRGAAPVRFSVEAGEPWLQVSPVAGLVGPAARIEVGADWPAVPVGRHRVRLRIKPETGPALEVEVPVEKSAATDARGFLETDRLVAIEAPHFSRAVAGAKAAWRTLPGFGRTVGGVTGFPAVAPALSPAADSPRLEYDVWLESTGDFKVTLDCAPSLDFLPGEPLRVAVSFDDAAPVVAALATGATPADWDRAVAESVRRVVTSHRVERPGNHVLKLWLVTPGVVVERLVIDAGGVRPSYLGPPESPRRPVDRSTDSARDSR